ncbi:MAG: glycerol-3-phosphate 1-O-acyltransferase PlsY [Endomicrobium sp.]|nr:glycerol-3-phosphate 1-O-acyltransferase PlsY [Endomicrobium sp.]
MLIKIIYIFVTYIITSIPFAYIFSKCISKIDIRTVGSKNVGTTNAFRMSGYTAGICTFILDVFKGWISVYVAKTYITSSFLYITIIIFTALVGHLFPIFLRFQGGKGVAVSLGMFVYLFLIPTIMSICIFIICFFIFGYVSLGSIMATISLPLFLILFKCQMKYVIVVSCISSIIVYKHKYNIKNIVITQKKAIKERRDRDSNPR